MGHVLHKALDRSVSIVGILLTTRVNIKLLFLFQQKY